MRRRLHFLRKARELAYRDLGGLVFDLHRFGQRHDELVIAKLATLDHIDDELRALEAGLDERRSLTVLREAGIAACPRCAAIHGSDDRFCPSCGMPVGVHADRPMAAPASASIFGAPAAQADQPATPPSNSPVQSPGQVSPTPGQSAQATSRLGSEQGARTEGTPAPSDLLRPATPVGAKHAAEDQPTRVITSVERTGDERSPTREQPTQRYDPPSISG